MNPERALAEARLPAERRRALQVMARQVRTLAVRPLAPVEPAPTHSSVRPAQGNKPARSRMKTDAVSRCTPGEKELASAETIEGLAA